MEEKFDALVNMVTQLNLTVTELKNAAPQHQQPNPNTENAREDKSMRVDVREFDGTSHDPGTYIEWEKGVERYFEYKDTYPDHQYKIAKVKLTKLATEVEKLTAIGHRPQQHRTLLTIGEHSSTDHLSHQIERQPTTKDREVNPKDIMCFKCHGHGHYKRNCPNARAFTQRESDEIHSRK